MKKPLILVAAALLILSAVPASAQFWSVPGSVGVIDEASSSLYEFSNTTLKFKSGQTGTIVARYPIYSPVSANPGWVNLGIGYSGPGVTVKIYSSPHCLQFQSTEGTFGPSTTTESNVCDPLSTSSISWDFESNSYWVEVTLTRSTTSTNPQLHHLDLRD